VLPYTSSAGSSGVAHLACQYGLPILASDIEDFVELAQQEQVSIEFFSRNSVNSMAEQLVRIFQNPEHLQAMAIANFNAALQMSMPLIIREYTRSFDMHQRVRMLKNFSRLRRARNGMPRRLWMVRQIEKEFNSKQNRNAG